MLFAFYFWLHHAACRLLVPWAESMDSGPWLWKCWLLTTGPQRNSLFSFDFIQHGCLSTWLKGILISLLFHLPVLDIPDLLFPSLVSYCQQSAYTSSFPLWYPGETRPQPHLTLASGLSGAGDLKGLLLSHQPSRWLICLEGSSSQGQSEHAVGFLGIDTHALMDVRKA